VLFLLVGCGAAIVPLVAAAAGFAHFVFRLGLLCGELWFLFCTGMALASASDVPISRAFVLIFGWGVSGAVVVVMFAGMLAWIYGGLAALPERPLAARAHSGDGRLVDGDD
jgi:hypothetical protein